MDLLYSRYASPVEFMNAYIAQGRFGEFVTKIFEMDVRRKREAIRKEDDNMLWQAYVHSVTDKTFQDWKDGLIQEKELVSYHMSDRQVNAVKRQTREILSRISPA